MGHDDAARNRQPHASPLRFCRKERLEKLLGEASRKSRTRVAHTDEHFAASAAMSAYHKASRVGAHNRHRFKCIEGQIEKYLEQLHAISHDAADIRINLHRNGDVLRQGIGSHDAEQVLQNFSGLDGSMSCFGPAHHVADSLDDLASAVSVCHDVGQQLTQLFGPTLPRAIIRCPALAFVTIAPTGLFTSCASDAASSPIKATRPTRASSVLCT